MAISPVVMQLPSDRRAPRLDFRGKAARLPTTAWQEMAEELVAESIPCRAAP